MKLFNRPGWPRPRGQYDPGRGKPRSRFAGDLPVPYIINADFLVPDVESVQWTKFGRAAANAAHDDLLCQICGERTGELKLLMALYEHRETSGPACHPRCAALSLRWCPHLRELDELGERVAYLVIGKDRRGYKASNIAEEFGIPFSSPVPVDDDAPPLWTRHVVALAKLDPMGEHEASAHDIGLEVRMDVLREDDEA